jgi:hypothetical protein
MQAVDSGDAARTLDTLIEESNRTD